MIELNDWNAGWVNRAYWIFDHLEDLNLDLNDTMVLMMIALFNETRTPVTMDALLKKSGLDPVALDESIQSLSAKGFLLIEATAGGLDFRLDGVLGMSTPSLDSLRQPVLDAFHQEFGRTLTPNEMDRIREMQNLYGEDMLLTALDEAAIRESRSLNYVESVCAAWTRKGLSGDDVMGGMR